ncbi:hypothetical protein AYI68_g6018 [Smittium mucronatum]|uniref:Transposase Helix-turn-helix domain-containing protein n=1 Tax=Smittium mucronatum TaxID=133383 RepID=A0A1R0GSM3_9FUNG|nr:hypothetical protein AYI68_g6018 [Smittium mucronatum]
MDYFDEIYMASEVDLLKTEMGRGKKSKFSPKDKRLILLTYLRHYFKYEKTGKDFGDSTPFICTTINFTAVVFRNALLKKYLPSIKKHEQISQSIVLENYIDVALIIDYILFCINRPFGSFSDSKIFYSGKNHRYCV